MVFQPNQSTPGRQVVRSIRWNNNKEKKAGGFNKIALRWPTNAFDTPEAIQIAEAD
tara:strand:+ start:415 stop:582 length:168 start_codon:yes stop_codon:yes gene_type:complete